MAIEPQKLGKYNIVGKIGKGAMGEVYKGHDPVLNRYVAIKTIADTLGTDADLVDRFKREARNAAQLNHPNIITIFDFVEEEGHLYMVMELLEGQDLKELIKSGAPLTVEQILSIMEQIADGLSFAHAKGIIHRDLKPANIHVSKNGQVKVLDFGLVHEASSDLTKTGQVMGTPNYMSPEQVQGMKVDPRSDIFSLGAVFYELLTRKKPFSADSIHATMFKVVQGDREPLAQYGHLPRPVVALVDRALDKDPEGRFADASALRAQLRVVRREVLRGGDADSTMSTAETTFVSPGPSGSTHSQSVPPAERSGPSRSGPGVNSSAGRGTLRRSQVGAASMGGPTPMASRPTGLYALVGVLVVGVAAGAYFMTRSSGPSGQDVDALNQQLLTSQLQLMERSLDQKDFQSALDQADEILSKEPQNAAAARVREQAREALDQIDRSVAETRAALERGATSEAADALAKVLALDPAHPLGVELSGQLNQHFQSQAEQARNEMDAQRAAAVSAGASQRPEFVQADGSRQQAANDFNRGEFTNSAQRYLEARDLYRKAITAQQSQSQRQAQADRQAEAAAQTEAAAAARLQKAESTWSRARQQPSETALTQQPSYQRSLTEAEVAERLKSAGDLDQAAAAYESAASYLERARRELTEAQARRAREEETRRAAATTAPPTTAPVTTSLPTVAQQQAEIRQVLANYERALETKNVDLFRQVKPNLTADEEKRLSESFQTIDSQQVDMTVDDIAIEGDTARVTVTRSDTVVVRGRSQGGKSRKSEFVLQKSGGSWVILQIGL